MAPAPDVRSPHGSLHLHAGRDRRRPRPRPPPRRCAARARRAEGLRARPRPEPGPAGRRGSCPVAFDLLDAASIAAAAHRAADATLLINNASTAEFAGPLDADARRRATARWPSTTTGTYAAIRAFVPVLEANGGGHIVNVLSLLSLASTPPMTGYSASKAAAHSLTQALRPVLAERGIARARRLPGRDRHRHGRRHRHRQDGAGARSPPACSTGSSPTRRTSSLTRTPRRWRRPGGATPRRSSARSPARLRRDRQHPERRGRADARPRRRAAAGCARMESAGCLRRYGPFLARDSEPNHGKSWMTSTV